MRHIFLYILTFIGICLLNSCSQPVPADTIADAEAALAAGDHQSARAVEQLVADSAITRLQPSQLCRIALIYMHLAEADKTRYDDDMAIAVRCYIHALQTNRDSVGNFLKRMPVSELPAINTLNELACAIASPVDVTETPADTIPADSI